MSKCRWIPTTVTPSGSLNPDGTLNTAAFTDNREEIAARIGQENLESLMDAIQLDIVNKGEDAADALAILYKSEIGVMQDNANGKFYAVAINNESEYGSYAGVFEMRCGVSLNLPWIVGGATILGLTGYAIGSGRKHAAIGAGAGAAAGAVVGLLLSKLATPAYQKSAGLGAVRRRRFR